MPVYAYGSTNISFSSTDTWANEISGLSNISVSGSASSWADDMYTLPGPNNISIGTELRNQSIFYGTVSGGSNGSWRVGGPYTTSYSTSAITIKNVNLTVHTSIRLQANPTYPYVFQQWRGDGSVISTSSTIDITTSAFNTISTFYAEFTTPASNSTTLSGPHNTCGEGSDITVYWSTADGSDWEDAYKLYTNASLTTELGNGKYDDGSVQAQVTNGSPGIPTSCIPE